MTNPIESWPPRRILVVFLILAVGCIALMSLINRNDQPLAKSRGARSGALEWVYSPRVAQCIVEDWYAAKLTGVVRHSVNLDFIFIPIYATFFAIACFWWAIHLSGRWHSTAMLLGWAAWLAGLFDIVENVGILAETNGKQYRLAPFTGSVAGTKWLIVAALLLFLLPLSLRTFFAWLERKLLARSGTRVGAP